ncbi:hypothetical protein PC41400_21545 [Paenibacillus chitinolyticus]|uniref:Copper amine oxidase-like N-terminal domain-containing protein n=1 Tax=Paenibacillus chitinolyticus TaxID=79263 RepID=A0A410X080_9BACL|nr:hypothetical protein [Paenibacillus chitinolyticus]MCY9593713.1 hypothetical protein [Paenibacillus chitinolyticus]MCY9599721.1 hypothetical protein [Paenibacillus chitinolyticus]QAV20108.1 hypothetical protein PC41400_21545 [Paenibacillus chitinolyticus]
MMKKYLYLLFGIFIGLGLSLGIGAHAEVTSMIGKVVEGSFPVLINGEKSEKDALVVDGTSYLPVRSAGQLFGYDVSFIDSQVILKAREGVVNLEKLRSLQQEQTQINDEEAAAKLKKWEQEKKEWDKWQEDLEKEREEHKKDLEEWLGLSDKKVE